MLLCLKLEYPDNVVLLRGNHESRLLTQTYGFYDECHRIYGSSSVWSMCTEVFDYLPLAAVINNQTFCVHGGIQQNMEVEDLFEIDRIREIPQEGLMCELFWSDPIEQEIQGKNPRGIGSTYSKDDVEKFLWTNGLTQISRSHQLVMEGFW